MNATSLYVSTCRLVLQANPEDPGCWADLYRLIPYLRQSLSCTVCGNLLIEPYTPTETNCQHHVCRSCKGGKKKLKPSCSWCRNYDKYVENVQLRILLQCYKKLCEYIINSSIFRLMCKTTASGDTNIANMTDLIQEGAGFKDEFKSNSGLSKSAYSILPCIYASASTQTITQAVNLNNDSENAIDDDVSVAKSNLSNGSSIYSVTYAGSGNKMVIKRKAMLNKGEMENCENLRLIKGSNFKRPIHRRGNFRGRGRGFKEEEKTNSTGVNNCTISSNNVNSGRVNVKKKKLGCRCGNATASPGKLTCCGQRCPCYVDSKACLDCKCRGCRNPHTKEGQKVIRDQLDSANSKLQSSAQLQTEEGIPTKGSGTLREGSRRSFYREKKSRDIDDNQSFSFTPTRDIKITVQSIENVNESKVKEIMVMIDFNGVVLSQSPPLPITNNGCEIEMTASIDIEDTTLQFLDEILANPVLFTVMDCTGPCVTEAEMGSLSASFEKEAKKKPSKASNSSKSTSKILMQYGSNILGMCNLDIGSLATGKKVVRETLLVEPEKRLTPPEVIPWIKLPKLTVMASTGDEPLISESLNKFNNVIGVTIESVYNFAPSLSDATVFDAIIPVPSTGDKTRRIKFSNGEATWTKDPICRKKWLNLLHLQGRGGRSKNSISPEMSDVFSSLPVNVNLKKEVKNRNRIIEWNMWRSSLMSKSDICFFYGKIMKHRIWPIEIVSAYKAKEVPQKEKSAKSDKKSKPQTTKSPLSIDHFIAYLNLTPLLHPGVTKARVAAQLFTYCQSELISKFGEDFAGSQSQISLSVAKNKSASRSKASVIEVEEKKNDCEIPLFDDEGHPTFIIVEVELSKPINLKRDPEPLEADLRAYLSLRGKRNKKTSNLMLMKESFSETIKKAVSILTQEYQHFSLSSAEMEGNQSEYADLTFQQFLWKRENFFKIKSTLENKIVALITEKYGGLDQYKEKIPEIYVYLVNEVHRITNNCLLEQECVSTPYYNNDDLQLYAEEAIEEGVFKTAEDYLLLRISRGTSNSDYWLDYAVYCIILKDYETAIEAVTEALCLDFNHQVGLLMFALLMSIIKNGSLAETTFEILLTKYPDYVEGWTALRLFYSLIGNNEGEMVANKEAERISAEQNFLENNKEEESQEDAEKNCKTYPHDLQNTRFGSYGVGSFKNGRSLVEPLSWSLAFCPAPNINIMTTTLLQKLGLYEFAAMTLSSGMEAMKLEANFSPNYVYYTCVNYYLERRYEEAVLLLQDFVKEYGKDCFLWSLMGHCYYKLQNHSSAIDCYEYVIESYNRPNDIHLIYLRMGFYYIEAGKFECAKRVLKTACKYSPTPKLWKGLGIAFLRMEELEEAEIAFSEANYLDNRDPETWAYLGIANAMLRRLDLFQQCCAEARKRDFKNPEIIKEIQALVLLNGLQGHSPNNRSTEKILYNANILSPITSH